MIHKVYDIVGQYAITTDGGQKIYEQIHPSLIAGEPVELDFAGVKVFASPFFNFAIGQLLQDISADKLNQLLEFTSLGSDGYHILERVIANAKHYYSDEQFRTAVDAVITDQAATL